MALPLHPKLLARRSTISWLSMTSNTPSHANRTKASLVKEIMGGIERIESDDIKKKEKERNIPYKLAQL